MPVNFDFSQPGGPAGAGGGSANPGPISQVDADTLGSGQNVNFTVSSSLPGGNEAILFRNTVSGNSLFLLDSGSDDVWTLNFQDTANTANTRLSGGGGNPVSLNFDVGAGDSVRIQILTTGGGTTGTVTATGGAGNITSTAPNVSGFRFTTLNPGEVEFIALNTISANALNCFLTGTQIATPKGEVEVETLQVGDTVMTADGAETEVKWVGVQNIDTRLVHPATANPICITAGAIADNVPARDLYVTADHAISIDGLLVNAGALINDSSIYQVSQMPLDGFSYYHIETEAHEVLLAEGCPAESLAGHQAERFDNRADRPKREIVEMDLPRITARRLLPDTTRARIDARAETLQQLPIAM